MLSYRARAWENWGWRSLRGRGCRLAEPCGVQTAVDEVPGDVAQAPVALSRVGAQLRERGVDADVRALGQDACGLLDHDPGVQDRLRAQEGFAAERTIGWVPDPRVLSRSRLSALTMSDMSASRISWERTITPTPYRLTTPSATASSE